jgi:hypothetical protein
MLLLCATPCMMLTMQQTKMLVQLSLTTLRQLQMHSQQLTPSGLLMTVWSCTSLASAAAQQAQCRQQQPIALLQMLHKEPHQQACRLRTPLCSPRQALQAVRPTTTCPTSRLLPPCTAAHREQAAAASTALAQVLLVLRAQKSCWQSSREHQLLHGLLPHLQQATTTLLLCSSGS